MVHIRCDSWFHRTRESDTSPTALRTFSRAETRRLHRAVYVFAHYARFQRHLPQYITSSGPPYLSTCPYLNSHPSDPALKTIISIMSFLANLFVSLKGTGSMNTNASLHSDGDTTSNRIDEDWEFITAHEAGVIYHDRITILLGPNRETRHYILIADMPKSSELLNYVRTLDPSHRNVHLFFPDLPMVKLYLKSPTISVESLAIEESWLDIIKLAITADVFQDPYVEGRALAALEQKGIIALAPGNAVLLFDQHDFAFAQEYQTKTGNGQKLTQTLNVIAKMGTEKSVTPKVQLPKAKM